ncbi:MAG: hypothetical protein N2049_10465 [Anaerolineales bacterium]|nr:hypothetical protein [Anaerolineales bacterium]MCX7609625.1 hypothetical protein [Anaerolineales bacterium]MDW8227230.1 hypothetical protein [Anaerolineales bacterium]
MFIRPLDLLDLPFLSRYRGEALSLNSARFLTRGNPLQARALLEYLDPRQHIYTAVAAENSNRLIGQIALQAEEPSARLMFLAPAEHLEILALPLLEHLVAQAGEWGALYVTAEVEEDSRLLQVFRRSGFALYAWQRVWKLPVGGSPAPSLWRVAEETDWTLIQSLHAQIVPALLQSVDGPPKMSQGLVSIEEGEATAYVAVMSGRTGVWLQPLISPDCAGATRYLSALRMVFKGNVPVYVCVRSYQAWLEATLEEIGAEAGARQAVMVKRLAVALPESQSVPSLEKVLARAKPAAPMSHLKPTTTSKFDRA